MFSVDTWYLNINWTNEGLEGAFVICYSQGSVEMKEQNL